MSDDYRHRTRLEVRFGDIDAFGHVNNAVTASYIEQGRIAYLRDVIGLDPVHNMPLILAHLSLDYDDPIFFGDEVEVASRVDWIGRTSLAMSHRLTSGADARGLASASSVLVAYDYAIARPMPVPDAWRSALAAHEGHALQRPAEAAR